MQASFVQKQQFGVKMNPQVIQSMKLMELPLVDLREKIEEELDRNPALEVVEDKSTVSIDDETEFQSEDGDEYFETSSDPGYSYKNGGAEASDEHHRFIEGALVRPETLQQHLLWQLQLEPVDGELRAVAAVLIQNLDDDGFHKEPPETLFQKNNDAPLPAKVSQSLLAKAMALVQALDPVGCCTANYRESLRVQVALLGSAAPSCLTESLDHLELFEKGNFSGAARKIKCSEEEARRCFELIKKLSPFPGRRFTPAGGSAGDIAEVRFVIPDVRVVRAGGHAGAHPSLNADDGDFVIILNDEVVPVLGINPFFDDLAPAKRDGGKEQLRPAAAMPPDSDAGQFARENVKEARVFINSIAMRKNTLKMLARALLDFQRPFFEKGPRHLVPLTLGDIAGHMGVHETTVSRAAHGKYMQTEWGIFELRYFFTNSISGSGSGGSRFSKEGVKAVIKELLDTEERNLSDQDISELLAGKGISLARRTVAKYRKELDMGSSYTR
jgi:RNA polymerase sigma-54 factor